MRPLQLVKRYRLTPNLSPQRACAIDNLQRLPQFTPTSCPTIVYGYDAVHIIAWFVFSISVLQQEPRAHHYWDTINFFKRFASARLLQYYPTYKINVCPAHLNRAEKYILPRRWLHHIRKTVIWLWHRQTLITIWILQNLLLAAPPWLMDFQEKSNCVD